MTADQTPLSPEPGPDDEDDDIQADIKGLEKDIVAMLKEVTG